VHCSTTDVYSTFSVCNVSFSVSLFECLTYLFFNILNTLYTITSYTGYCSKIIRILLYTIWSIAPMDYRMKTMNKGIADGSEEMR
jgi:hypothetical protein